jgi:hypothetical protein
MQRALAHRVSGGIHVSLYWDEVDDTLTLEVYDAKSDDYFELGVPRDRALDAFHHPYAYLAASKSRKPDEVAAAEAKALTRMAVPEQLRDARAPEGESDDAGCAA